MYIYMYNIEVSFTEHDNLLIICLTIANESNFNKKLIKKKILCHLSFGLKGVKI